MRRSCIIHILSIALSVAACSEPVRYLESQQRDGYTCSLIEYMAGTNRIQAYLLMPDGEGPHPGIVMLHDHGARFDIGKEKLVKPLPSAPEYIKASSGQWIRDNFDGVYLADRFAAEGFAVIVPDALYWGSRSSNASRRWSRAVFGDEPIGADSLKALKKEVYEGQRMVYDSLRAKGVVWAEQTLEEDKAAASLLSGLPSVDASRIGAFGWSMGAHRAWLLTAYDKDIKAGCALSWMTLKSFQKIPYSASEYSMLIPRLRDSLDFPDIARELAPRPFYFLSGTEDKLFPGEAVDSCYTRMHEIYGESDALRTEFFPGPHHCGKDVQEKILSWLRDILQGV